MRWMSSLVAMSPAMTAAGSPGVRYSSENTTNATTAITTMVENRRRKMYAIIRVGPDSSGRANEFAPTRGTRGDRYFFSTFHMSVIGAMITPERFVRYAVGRMNCAVGTYG